MGVRYTGTWEIVGSVLKLIRSRFSIIFKIDLVLVMVWNFGSNIKRI